ncbi:MAG: phage distal tail protein [Christensenellales bacterium]|jgi:hypothetical protein
MERNANSRSLSLKLDIGGRAFHIDRTSPYRLLKLEGTEAGDYSIYLGENAYMDGGFLQGQKVEPRSIRLTFEASVWQSTEKLRGELIESLRPKSKGRLTISRGDVTRAIDFYIAGRPKFIQKNIYDFLRVDLDLLCPDPYFTDPNEKQERFLRVLPVYSAPLSTYRGGGTVAGLFTRSDSVKLVNSGHADIGVVAEIFAEHGDIINPRVSAGSQEIKVLQTIPLGARLAISTVKGEKSILLDGEPVSSFDRKSIFFQLPPGEHQISISADSGSESAFTTLSYRLKYLGV